ncbi:unnamed protein product [Spirodela intermedia]|uniref:RING-type E3 ubiquitin transferase n=1 Tax=Spirodela intermedia TaxID=51605 RepID=A0ABN7EEF3_SPIIN|nr:unnamed protein product [Spirodela intermedia]
MESGPRQNRNGKKLILRFIVSAQWCTGNGIAFEEDYADGEDLGVLTCWHDFHASCVGKWLVQQNVSPLCKKTALST